MKRHSMYKLFVLLLSTAVLGFNAISQTPTPIPNQPTVSVPRAPSLAAKSYISDGLSQRRDFGRI